MVKHNQDGMINGMLISLILCILLLCAAIGFGFWAYNGRQDYKNHTDAKVQVAVTAAVQRESTLKDQQFAEQEKQPLRPYNGPQAFGNLVVNFPKTWGAYVDDTGKGNALVDGYFDPNVVPSINDMNSIFALRVQVLQAPYSQTLQSFIQAEQNRGNNIVPLTLVPYALPKVPQVVGIEASGTLPGSNNVVGTAVVLPLRSYTLEIWTMGDSYLADYNNYILPNFSFSP